VQNVILMIACHHPGNLLRLPTPPCKCFLPVGGTLQSAVTGYDVEDQMAEDDLRAELERLKAENERLKTQRGRSVSLKVSEKGGVSVYGLGRFPVTLYKEQWSKLLAMADEIKAFLKEHDAELKAKPE
jgi:hypothetical protein